MGDREAQKTAWEVEQGTLVAGYLNGTQGTDYEARAADAEPSDVVLISPTVRFPARNAQVVSIPLDFRHRDDKQTVIRVQERLAQFLKERGIDEIYVGLSLGGEGEMHGMARPQVEQLADLIVQKRGDQDVTLQYHDTYEHFPELAELVHTIFISRPDVFCGMQIDIPAGGAIPPDGRWIEEGIRHKLARYGGEEAVRNLTLIIGVAGFVDDEQVVAFQRAFCEANLPFAEIYINTPFDGTVCLKAAR